MTNLEIRFIPQAEMNLEIQREIDTLDHLAFAGDDLNENPEFSSIQWSSPDWMGLGFLQGRLVTQLCLPRRRILVSSQEVWVAGLGGMATHPNFQHQGLGSRLLAATEIFMRDRMRVPFGLLICATETRPFYERSRWQFAADMLYFMQDGQRRTLRTPVMVQSLAEQPWPAGKIDLCGLPW